MGFLDRMFGRPEPVDSRYASQPLPPLPPNQPAARSQDEIAIERYRYLLRTAPPETIEQVHAEAFAKLTPAQRSQVFQSLSAVAAPGEAPRGDDPASLARATTRAEMRAPGTAERTFGGMGFGGTFASSMLGTIVGFTVGSMLASAFLPDPGLGYADPGLTDPGAADATTADAGWGGGGDTWGG